MYLTNDPKIAKIAQDVSVDRIFLDLETRGKAERQANMDTVISHNSIDDVKKLPAQFDGMKLRAKIYCDNYSSAETFENFQIKDVQRGITAIVCTSDYIALPIMTRLQEHGLRIPDDISVMGFDDASFASLLDVPLTTMIHPKYQIGKWAAEMLFDQLDSQGRSMPHQMLLHPNIVVRHSVKILR